MTLRPRLPHTLRRITFPSLRAGASLGAAARLHALATFAPQSVARRYADVYRDAIASSPK